MALSTPIPDKLPETSEVKLFRSDTPSSNFDGFLSQYANLQQQADSEAAVSRSAQAGAMRRGLNRRREITSRMPETPRAPTEFREMPKPTERPVGDPMNVFKTFAPALAVLASFKARRPLVSSMNALASAMEGYQKGDMDVYNRESQIWDDNFKTALQENKSMIDRYDLIVDQYGNDMARMEVELKLAAKEMDDEKTIAALSSPGGAASALKRFEDMAKLQVQLQRAAGAGKGPSLTAAQANAIALDEARQYAMETGDWTKFNDLWATGKFGTKNTVIDESGVKVMPGAEGAVSTLQAAEKRGNIIAQKEEDLPKTTIAIRNALITSENVGAAISNAEKLAESATSTGVPGYFLETVPTSDAFNLRKSIDTIVANIGLDKLQAIREASPTGGALGQVTDFENRLLQATIASLEQSQSKGQFKANLARVKSQYERSIDNIKAAYELTYGDTKGFDKYFKSIDFPQRGAPSNEWGMEIVD
jgi:hypothetical protein